MERSLRASQLPVSSSVLALRPTSFIPPGTAILKCDISRLTYLNSRPPLSHSLCGVELPRWHSLANRPALLSKLHALRLICKKSCQNALGNASGSSTILCQKAVMPLPNSTRPMAVWMTGCRLETRWPSYTGPARELGELSLSNSTSNADSSFRRQAGAFRPSTSVAVTSTAVAAAVEKVAWSSDRNMDTSVLHVSSFSADRGSTRMLNAANLTPGAWRHTIGDRSRFASLRHLMDNMPWPGAPSPCERHQPWEREHYLTALHEREPLSPFRQAVQ